MPFEGQVMRRVIASSACIIGWAFVLGMLLRAGGQDRYTFIAIYNAEDKFASVLLTILLAYWIPVGFLMAWVVGRSNQPKKQPDPAPEKVRSG